MKLNQHPSPPESPSKICSIGTGGIVRNAHYPAYKLMGWEIAGLYDVDAANAQAVADEFQVGPVVAAIKELDQDCIYDVAVPGNLVASVLDELPDQAYVLIQKPLGETLDQAREIVALCEKKKLKAAVNFQLRWAPYSLALKELIKSGELGEVHDLEFHVCVHTPWANWTFLEKAPRMEMVYHSIHYIDFTRHLFGEPIRVLARSIKDPRSPKLESSRSYIYFDYGDMKRATIHTYHGHIAGPRHQDSYIKVEGTKGVAKIQMGLNMDYPKGRPDYFEYWLEGMTEWQVLELEGSWFPHAFRGPMADMMTWRSGGPAPSTIVQDALQTMFLVDCAYQCSDCGGVLL